MSLLRLATLCAAIAAAAPAAAEPAGWAAVLDSAHTWSFEDAGSLRTRLELTRQALGVDLDAYASDQLEPASRLDADADEAPLRRRAVARLLDHLAYGRAGALDEAVAAARALEGRLGRFENRYWHHTVLAHRALERGDAGELVRQIQALWLRVVVPLEGAYRSARGAPGPQALTGFIAALPFVYESLARLIAQRAPAAGLAPALDALAPIARMLDRDRAGASPEAVPPGASVAPLLREVVERLDSTASDGGSLSFALALLEADRLRGRARASLEATGPSGEALASARAAAAAYERALRRAETPEGECAVHTRALGLQAELHAARQRFGRDLEVRSALGADDAIAVYARLYPARDGGWGALGYRGADRAAFLAALHGLWNAIEEANLSTGDYYLSRAAAEPALADAHSRSAARAYALQVAVFDRFARPGGQDALPESAYFGAFEAALGVGDAYLAFASAAAAGEVDAAQRHYRRALSLFPFDRRVWWSATNALGRHGRESASLELARVVSDRVSRSPAVAAWVAEDRPNAAEIAAVLRGFSSGLALAYLGFGEASELTRLEGELERLRADHADLAVRLESLVAQRDRALAEGPAEAPASPDPSAERTAPGAGRAEADLTHTSAEIALLRERKVRLDRQIAARAEALPLYRDALQSDDLAAALRGRRDHPLHALLRRLYYEGAQ